MTESTIYRMESNKKLFIVKKNHSAKLENKNMSLLRILAKKKASSAAENQQTTTSPLSPPHTEPPSLFPSQAESGNNSLPVSLSRVSYHFMCLVL